jgi:hypothetical protein
VLDNGAEVWYTWGFKWEDEMEFRDLPHERDEQYERMRDIKRLLREHGLTEVLRDISAAIGQEIVQGKDQQRLWDIAGAIAHAGDMWRAFQARHEPYRKAKARRREWREDGVKEVGERDALEIIEHLDRIIKE